VNIDAFLARIGYDGPRAPTLQTLFGVHRALLTAVPYEGIDVYLQQPVGIDLAAIFDKIVNRGRGGWCFEMNTLLFWTLRELGFDVQRLSSTVRAETPEAFDGGGHMLLRVRIDGADWMADAGFGNGILNPIPWRAGSHAQYFHIYQLEPIEDGRYWRFTNQAHDAGGYFVISLASTSDETFLPSCMAYQDDPASSWRSRLNCLIYAPNGDYHELRGRVYSHVTRSGKSRAEIATFDAFAAHLHNTFKIALDAQTLARLWAKVCADHEAWLRTRGLR
jgi:N-hydroxyarylamine O-acetyltransferase